MIAVIFLKVFPIDSPSPFIASDIVSVFPVAKLVNRLVQAAFVAFTEPVIVSDASLAVVPVILRDSCVLCIASISLSNPTELMLFAVATNPSPITPVSFTILAISEAVPPNPNFKLSNIV